MHKNSTHQSSLFKFLLVTVMVCCLLFRPNNATAVYNNTDSIGIQTKNVKCYPNPAVSFVNFDIPADYLSKNYSLQVFSFTGKKMYEVNLNMLKHTLTFTNNFYRGIYIYQVKDRNGKIIETGKFQVNK